MDNWTWVARYEDGSSIAELDPAGDHGFADVDLGRVRQFELFPLDPSAGQLSFCILVAEGEQPFFTRVRGSGWLLRGGDTKALHTCLGLQREGQTTYVTFDDHGRVVISGERVL